MSPTTTLAPATRKRAARSATTPATRLLIPVATCKGAWLFHGDARRKAWVADGPHFGGHNISHLQLDPRDGRTLLAAAKNRPPRPAVPAVDGQRARGHARRPQVAFGER
jgi:hypothetical protein